MKAADNNIEVRARVTVLRARHADRPGIKTCRRTNRGGGMTMLSRLAAPLALCLAASSVAAQVKDGTGSRLGSKTTMVGHLGYVEPDKLEAQPTDVAASIGQRVAECVSAREHTNVVKYLAGPDVAFDPLKKVTASCLGKYASVRGVEGSSISLPTSLLRGMLAEAELRRMAFPTLAASAAVRKEYDGTWMSKDTGGAVLDEMGACLADWRPSESIALLKTTAASPDESQAIAALGPLLGACLRTGAVLRANAAGLRSAIALGVYHRVVDGK